MFFHENPTTIFAARHPPPPPPPPHTCIRSYLHLFICTTSYPLISSHLFITPRLCVMHHPSPPPQPAALIDCNLVRRSLCHISLSLWRAGQKTYIVFTRIHHSNEGYMRLGIGHLGISKTIQNSAKNERKRNFASISHNFAKFAFRNILFVSFALLISWNGHFLTL